jgi:hypothetical protein
MSNPHIYLVKKLKAKLVARRADLGLIEPQASRVYLMEAGSLHFLNAYTCEPTQIQVFAAARLQKTGAAGVSTVKAHLTKEKPALTQDALAWC